RDNASLSRSAYVEFDLEAMMEGQLYTEFSLLWLVCHQSRVEDLRQVGSEGGEEPRPGAARARGDKTASRVTAVDGDASDEAAADGTEAQSLLGAGGFDCWLERWSKTAAEQGTRALDALRQGVEESITVL